MDTIEKAMQKLGNFSIRTTAPQQEEPIRPLESSTPESVAAAANSNLAAVISPKRTTGKRTRRAVALDMERIRQAGMVMPDSKRSRIKEEYRHIKRPLLMNAAGKGAIGVEHRNLIMVTSARQEEGKTFTALNLALSIANERDRTVLLVDADVVKPGLSKFFGIDSGPGLVDFLIAGNLDLSEVLVETNIPSLTLLPAGNTHHHLSTELLASESMRQLAEEMSTRYSDRIIIFDSPPLLSTTEASVLAHLMGQVVMVVEAERTRQAQVKEALALLKPDMMVGFVLNKTRLSLGSDYYYGPYYYAGYGQEQE